MFCVIDTERIKGDQIYLFSYVLFDDNFNLVESKTFLDESIDLSNRHSPKAKVKALHNQVIKIDSFNRICSLFNDLANKTIMVVFSKTDINVIRSKCRQESLDFVKPNGYDLQQALFDLSESPKHKSNLKDYCKSHKIKHSPHIPDSDCCATFEVFKDLIKEFGIDYLSKYKI